MYASDVVASAVHAFSQANGDDHHLLGSRSSSSQTMVAET